MKIFLNFTQENKKICKYFLTVRGLLNFFFDFLHKTSSNFYQTHFKFIISSKFSKYRNMTLQIFRKFLRNFLNIFFKIRYASKIYSKFSLILHKIL